MHSASSTTTCRTFAPCSASSAPPAPIAATAIRGLGHRDAAHRLLARAAGPRRGSSGSRGWSPPPTRRLALRAEAQLRCGHLAYWITDFARGEAMASSARASFHELGDPLGEGRALRRLGAIAAATDDLAAARSWLEQSLSRLEEAGVEAEIGVTLLHLGSLLADEGDVDAALPALHRALSDRRRQRQSAGPGTGTRRAADGRVEGGDLEAALRSGEDALRSVPRARSSHHGGNRRVPPRRGQSRSRDGPTSRASTRSSRSTPVRLPGRGPRSRSATSNLARLDLNDGDADAAADTARRGARDHRSERRPLGAGRRARSRRAAAGRAATRPRPPSCSTPPPRSASEIRQPVPPTDASELEATRRRIDALGLAPPHRRRACRRGGHPARATAALHGVRELPAHADCRPAIDLRSGCDRGSSRSADRYQPSHREHCMRPDTNAALERCRTAPRRRRPWRHSGARRSVRGHDKRQDDLAADPARRTRARHRAARPDRRAAISVTRS